MLRINSGVLYKSVSGAQLVLDGKQRVTALIVSILS